MHAVWCDIIWLQVQIESTYIAQNLLVSVMLGDHAGHMQPYWPAFGDQKMPKLSPKINLYPSYQLSRTTVL